MARARIDAAKRRHRSALRRLERAYLRCPAPTLLRDMARSHSALGATALARRFNAAYLAARPVGPTILFLDSFDGVDEPTTPGTTAAKAPKRRPRALRAPVVLTLHGSAQLVPPGARRRSRSPIRLFLDTREDEPMLDGMRLRAPLSPRAVTITTTQPHAATSAQLTTTRNQDGTTTFSVVTRPEGASVSVSGFGMSVGATPIEARAVEAGRAYTLIIKRPGYRTIRRTIRPRRGAHTRLVLQLERR